MDDTFKKQFKFESKENQDYMENLENDEDE
jgi:hypothetical protein